MRDSATVLEIDPRLLGIWIQWDRRKVVLPGHRKDIFGLVEAEETMDSQLAVSRFSDSLPLLEDQQEHPSQSKNPGRFGKKDTGQRGPCQILHDREAQDAVKR